MHPLYPCLGQLTPVKRRKPPCNSTASAWRSTTNTLDSSAVRKQKDPKRFTADCELSHLWLQMEIHTKEHIIKLLVLEQFLTILPEGIQTWVQRLHPETCEEVIALVEDFHLIHQEIGKCGQKQVIGSRAELRRSIP
ncbi:unnamed protein product [Eretmochelys imbricata]